MGLFSKTAEKIYRFLNSYTIQTLVYSFLTADVDTISTNQLYLLGHLQQGLVAALPPGAIHGRLLLELFDLFSHL